MNTGATALATANRPGRRVKKPIPGVPLGEEERRFWQRPEVQKLAAKVREIKRYKPDSDANVRPTLDAEERRIADEIVKRDEADIWKTAMVFFALGRQWGALGSDIEIQDMAQEGLLAKFLAISEFDVERGVSFKTYGRCRAEHRMLNTIQHNLRLKRKYKRAGEAADKPPRYLRAPDDSALQSIINRAEINIAFERAGLSDEQVLLMEARAVGMNNKAIASESGVTFQAVFNRETRAKERLQRCYEDAREVA